MMPLPSPSFSLFAYFCTKSVAPEKATWAMYFTTSSPVMPRPLSMNWIVPFFGLVITSTRYSGFSSTCASPLFASRFSLLIASQPLDTSSRTKMSLSEYSHCLMTGMMFSALMDTVPFPNMWDSPPSFLNGFILSPEIQKSREN